MNARDWLVAILKDKGIDPKLVADKPATIYGYIDGVSQLEFTIRINLTDQEFANYAKVAPRND